MDSAEILRALAAVLPSEALVVDRDITMSLSHDEAEWAPVGKPRALVRATSSDHVVAAVRVCAGLGVPVTARGAGTGLSGGANAIEGGVIIALDRLKEIRLIDPLERLAVVQAGVINDELRAAAAKQGLWYPPDPASSPWSTIGGNIATNAGGVCCVKYGVTKDYVLALEVVTGTGELVRLGRVTAKGVAGYDLVGLMVGSEGTLGIVTEATVRLKPLPAPPRTSSVPSD
jgi:glycolate oxidase